ncbi:hypothetical protein L0F63_000161 [Massospora cicadina]|nr:hypothetical protein L0F63_000161 [Massospora cicadina]
MGMEAYQREFIEFSIELGVLQFGEFKLKSGRISPYFFNAGLFHQGSSITKMGRFYAAAIQHSGFDYDVLFGPAYKGIPLACSAAVALYEHHQVDKPFSFNRKEKKDHGEDVLIIDDVITAGTAIRESIDLISARGATPVGVIVAVDRQERGQSSLSAIQQLATECQLPVKAIVTLSQIIEYLEEKGQHAGTVAAMKTYLEAYRPIKV